MELLCGTFFSHGLAILFGSKVSSLSNDLFQFYLKVITYVSFLLFGILGFVPKKEKNSSSENGKSSFLNKVLNIKINYVFIVAICIMIGELGDKTFLASLGLGLQYPAYKLSLIFGSVFGMVLSNCVAIFFGRILGNFLKQSFIEFLSNVIFIVFSILGFVGLVIK